MNDDRSSVTRLLMDERFRAWVNEPTPELDTYWEARLRQYPEEEQWIYEARQVLLRLDFSKNKRIDREGILDRALSQVEQQERQLTHHHVHSFAPYWVAATLVGIIAAISYYWLYRAEVQTLETAYGESQTIVLPDSSTVVLNANSSLSFRHDWEDAQPRRVTLHGEAFFSVTHRVNDQKFIVQTNDLAIEVLGTEFNVNYRRDATEVVLERGSIRLDWSNESMTGRPLETVSSMTVKPGERVVFSEKQRKLTKRQVDPTVYSAWTDGRLVFDQTPLRDVFTMIEDNYGYQVQTNDPAILQWVFTADIRDASLDLLLDFLSESFGLQITKKSSSIIITEKATTER